jgi:hypothetical protein
MEGKKPGQIRVRKAGYREDKYFVPYFLSILGNWHGIHQDGAADSFYGEGDYWQLYTEPKPKVKRAQYMIFYGANPLQTPNYFRDDEEVWSDYPSVKRIERLPETEREFDE